MLNAAGVITKQPRLYSLLVKY